MSHSTNVVKNKQQKHSKVFFRLYLDNIAEPKDRISNDIPPDLEAELLESSYLMKRRVRRLAQRIRTYYS